MTDVSEVKDIADRLTFSAERFYTAGHGPMMVEAAAEIARLHREKAALMEALKKIAHDRYTDADERILSDEPIMIWQAVALAALRSATETKDGQS